eukprot:SAG11_NODE_1563_length_4675_cov_10.530376_3_plen_153_part_00
MKLVQHHVLVLSCVACGSAVEAGGPLTGPLPSFTYGNMVCWAAYCIPYSNFLGQYHRTYGLSHMDGIVLVCSTLLNRSLPVFLYAKTFKTGDGQVYSNCPVDKSVRSIKTSGYCYISYYKYPWNGEINCLVARQSRILMYWIPATKFSTIMY